MYKLKIEHDSDPIDPRKDFDNSAVMLCLHKRYTLGDKHSFTTPDEIRSAIPKDAYTLPLYLYDHSGITMRTTPFNCPWDSGQVGFIYITPIALKNIGLPNNLENANKVMNQEVATYDQYLTGDVWYYTITKSKEYTSDDGDTITQWEYVDSCHGIFGREYAESEGKSVLNTYQDSK